MSAPAKEVFRNASQTTLNGAIDASQTSITVADGSQFPSTGNFRLIIESEILLCTARSTNTLTVQRGAEGSTAASHSSGMNVVHIATSGGMERWSKDVDPMRGAQPAFGVYNDAGDAPLVAADFTSINFGTDTKTDQGQTILLNAQTQAGLSLAALVRSAPSTPYSIIAAFRAVGPVTSELDDVTMFGLCFRESSTGKLIILGDGIFAEVASLSSVGMARLWVIEKFTNPTTFSAAYKGPRSLLHVGPESWMKIEDDGTNLKFYVGDGVSWVQLHSVSRTDFMAGGPNQVGWFARNQNNNDNRLLVRLCHWSKE